jgi:hypothetical protein
MAPQLFREDQFLACLGHVALVLGYESGGIVGAGRRRWLQHEIVNDSFDVNHGRVEKLDFRGAGLAQ